MQQQINHLVPKSVASQVATVVKNLPGKNTEVSSLFTSAGDLPSPGIKL